jgi:hypothetical protein
MDPFAFPSEVADDPEAEVAANHHTQPVLRPKIGNTVGGIPWTGGKPSLAWSSSALFRPKSPYSYRASSLEAMTQSWTIRTRVGSRVYKLHDPAFSLFAFATATQTHMTVTGMDSIFYIKSEDNTSMINVITQYQRTTLAHVRTATQAMHDAEVYDAYDEDNIQTAMIWLQWSIDPVLLDTLLPRLADCTSAAVLWMLIVTHTYANSVLGPALAHPRTRHRMVN